MRLFWFNPKISMAHEVSLSRIEKMGSLISKFRKKMIGIS